MNRRRILVQVTAPAVAIGLVLFGATAVSVWSMNRLQKNLADILANNVASLVAAQDLETCLRQLRFHSFIYVMDPGPERLAAVQRDEVEFETALQDAKLAQNLPEEAELIHEIETGYRRYRDELDVLPPRSSSRMEFVHWADKHPVRHLAAPIQELLRVNKESMEETARESRAVSEKAQVAMLILGILGPMGGLLSGYGIARGLSRSISRLIVRLEDVRARLDQDVASVKLSTDKPAVDLDRQLDLIVNRVKEVAEQMQRQHAEMLRAEQLAAVGRLAASVAHEVRNPLTGIKLLVGAALNARNQPPLSVEDLEVIYGEIGRLELTVQELLDFARPPRVCRENSDLREVVRQAADLVRARADQKRIVLRLEQPDQPVRAPIDRRQVANVVVNLLMNALDATPAEGSIAVSLEVDADHRGRLIVRDSGPGFADEIKGKLFTPFVSTKPTGTGLGLSICRRVVEEHGGQIAGRTVPEGGAEFEVILPLAEEAISCNGCL